MDAAPGLTAAQGLSPGEQALQLFLPPPDLIMQLVRVLDQVFVPLQAGGREAVEPDLNPRLPADLEPPLQVRPSLPRSVALPRISPAEANNAEVFVGSIRAW